MMANIMHPSSLWVSRSSYGVQMMDIQSDYANYSKHSFNLEFSTNKQLHMTKDKTKYDASIKVIQTRNGPIKK